MKPTPEERLRISARWHLARGEDKRDAGDLQAGAAYIEESRMLSEAADAIIMLRNELEAAKLLWNDTGNEFQQFMSYVETLANDEALTGETVRMALRDGLRAYNHG